MLATGRGGDPGCIFRSQRTQVSTTVSTRTKGWFIPFAGLRLLCGLLTTGQGRAYPALAMQLQPRERPVLY
jgi:hypothetical protein